MLLLLRTSEAGIGVVVKDALCDATFCCSILNVGLHEYRTPLPVPRVLRPTGALPLTNGCSPHTCGMTVNRFFGWATDSKLPSHAAAIYDQQAWDLISVLSLPYDEGETAEVRAHYIVVHVRPAYKYRYRAGHHSIPTTTRRAGF